MHTEEPQSDDINCVQIKFHNLPYQPIKTLYSNEVDQENDEDNEKNRLLNLQSISENNESRISSYNINNRLNNDTVSAVGQQNSSLVNNQKLIYNKNIGLKN